MRLVRRVLCLLPMLFAAALRGQFDLQESHTTASLRGIDAPTAAVAWASGSGGTVLRTLDGGATWLNCATPPGGEKLDFRGVQGLDADTAVVMSSGKGALSRIYKTADGCKTWTLAFTNPDEDGFFDAMRRVNTRQLYLLGDPVGGKFAMFLSQDKGDTWLIADDPGLEASAGDGAFAASNTALMASGATLFFATGGTNLPRVYAMRAECPKQAAGAPRAAEPQTCPVVWGKADVPLAGHAAAAGAFSLASRNETSMGGKSTTILVAVGGIYDRPTETAGTAASSYDSGRTWRAAVLPPGGYRSAVAFDRIARLWIAVGPTGVDVSADDGKTWRSLAPGPGDTAETAQGWNAVALPFVVGAKGRIGRLRAGALKS